MCIFYCVHLPLRKFVEDKLKLRFNGWKVFWRQPTKMKFPLIEIQPFNNVTLNFIMRIFCDWQALPLDPIISCSRPISASASIIHRFASHIAISKPLNLSDYPPSHSLEYHFTRFFMCYTANINNKAWYRNGKESKRKFNSLCDENQFKKILLNIFLSIYFSLYGLARSGWELSK